MKYRTVLKARKFDRIHKRYGDKITQLEREWLEGL